MPDYSCPKCSEPFSERNAICEDWRDPNKAFGCPHCNRFFIREMVPEHWSGWVGPLSAVTLGLADSVLDGHIPRLAINALMTVAAFGALASLYYLWKRWHLPSYVLVAARQDSDG